MNKFGKEALDVHNKYRVLHQVPELKWSRKLEKDAETWANQLAKEGRLKHDDTDDGENVYAVMGKDDVTGAEVVDRWYSEVEKYDFNKPGFKNGIGHFTQVVWKETKELGIAKAKSNDGKIFVVARYHPAGNYMNQFQDNVKPKATEQNGDVTNPAETKKITSDWEKRDCKATSSPKEEFPKQSLEAHNKFRSMHGVPPLSWADDLAKDAQAWAEKLANSRTLKHASKSERNDAGENIAMFTGSFDTAGEKATDMWYGEYKDYDFSRGGWQKGTGHFTQVVWKSTKELGIGRAKTADGKMTFVVGRYRPAGNILNYMADNVFDLSHKA